MAIATTYGELAPGGPRIIRSVRPLIGPQHALGHEGIDSDHLAIADWWLRTVQCEPVQFAFFVARLKKLMREHFDREATLMEKTGGQMCECHRQEHRMLLALCDQANALSGCHWRKARSLLRAELPPLFRKHIISMDQLTVLFINTHGEAFRTY